MPISITVSGNSPAELRDALVSAAAAFSPTGANQVTSAAVEEAKPAAKAEKAESKKAAKAEKAEKPAQKYTLQDALDRATKLAGDGKDENILVRIQGAAKKLGGDRISLLPADKIDDFMAELDKEFPDSVAAEAKTSLKSLF